MEILTTVEECSRQLELLQIPPDTSVRIVINEVVSKNDYGGDEVLPRITPEEQRRLLNRLSGKYQIGVSEELIKIIEASHTNTDEIRL